MNDSNRQDMVDAYLANKPPPGIFAVRCTKTGDTWVGASRNPDKHQNAIWFELNLGKYRNKSLQTSWNTNGEAAFTYEVVEDIDDANEHAISRLMDARAEHWRTELNATAVNGR